MKVEQKKKKRMHSLLSIYRIETVNVQHIHRLYKITIKQSSIRARECIYWCCTRKMGQIVRERTHGITDTLERTIIFTIRTRGITKIVKLILNSFNHFHIFLFCISFDSFSLVFFSFSLYRQFFLNHKKIKLIVYKYENPQPFC